jgi:hypothetical protein
MSTTAFPSSAMGLPASLKYDLPPSMSDSARSYSVNVAPDGQNTVTGPSPVTATAFVANSTGAFGNYTSQNISFTIPSGMSDSVFLDPVSTTLSFTLTYTASVASSTTNGIMALIGSGASWFDALTLYSNNTPIETINQYGMLQNFLLQNTVNLAERYGGISVAMGADSNGANGIDLGTTATSFRYNFCIPLLSVIGVNSDKLFPVGSVNNLQLIMTTANITPVASYCTAVATQPTFTTGFNLSEFQLNMKYVDVGDMAAQQLRQTLQDGKWYMKSQTYTNSSVNIPSGSIGSQQLLLQIRNTSVKSIIHQFGIVQGATAINGYYDAFNPALTSRQCQVGGQFFPNRPINDCARPAEGYPYLIQALGGGIAKSLGTVVGREMYNAVLPSVPTGSDSTLVVPASGVRAAPAGGDGGSVTLIKYPNSAYYGYDLEKSQGILFGGLNTRASPPFLNLFLAVAAGAATICQAWGISDVVLVFDSVSKQVQAFI